MYLVKPKYQFMSVISAEMADNTYRDYADKPDYNEGVKKCLDAFGEVKSTFTKYDDLFDNNSADYARLRTSFLLTEFTLYRMADFVYYSFNYSSAKDAMTLSQALAYAKIEIDSINDPKVAAEFEDFRSSVQIAYEFGSRTVLEKKMLLRSSFKKGWKQVPVYEQLNRAFTVISNYCIPIVSNKARGYIDALTHVIKFLLLTLVATEKLDYDVELVDIRSSYLRGSIGEVVDRYVRSTSIIQKIEAIVKSLYSMTIRKVRIEKGVISLSDDLLDSVFSAVQDYLIADTSARFNWLTYSKSFLHDMATYQDYYEIAKVRGYEYPFVKELLIPNPMYLMEYFAKEGKQEKVITWVDAEVEAFLRNFEAKYKGCIEIWTDFINKFFEPFSSAWKPSISTVARQNGKNTIIMQAKVISEFAPTIGLVSRELDTSPDSLINDEASHYKIEGTLSKNLSAVHKNVGYKELTDYSSDKFVVGSADELSYWALANVYPVVSTVQKILYDPADPTSRTYSSYNLEYRDDIAIIHPSKVAKYSNYLGTDHQELKAGKPYYDVDHAFRVMQQCTNSLDTLYKIWFSVSLRIVDPNTIEELFVSLSDQLITSKADSRPQFVLPSVSDHSVFRYDSNSYYMFKWRMNPELFKKRDLICFRHSNFKPVPMLDCKINRKGVANILISRQNVTPLLWSQLNGNVSDPNGPILIDENPWRGNALNNDEILISIPYEIYNITASTGSKVYKTDDNFRLRVNYDHVGIGSVSTDDRKQIALYKSPLLQHNLEDFIDPYPMETSAMGTAVAYLKDLYFAMKTGIVKNDEVEDYLPSLHQMGNFFKKMNADDRIYYSNMLALSFKWGKFTTFLLGLTEADLIMTSSTSLSDNHPYLNTSTFITWMEENLLNAYDDIEGGNRVMKLQNMFNLLQDKDDGIIRPITLSIPTPSLEVNIDRKWYFDSFTVLDEIKSSITDEIKYKLANNLIS